ncbi:uncharacterized protein C8orf58 homolog [Strigops habroptila]|uniref:uncharacterized protein C8orf58 homolog n=1 Tax=Strigops habroptila TaxID=2489341 RepID=UPI0011D02042|nr:uncharacterized protein C8orf58 homolog [Strigops habroptila]
MRWLLEPWNGAEGKGAARAGGGPPRPAPPRALPHKAAQEQRGRPVPSSLPGPPGASCPVLGSPCPGMLRRRGAFSVEPLRASQFRPHGGCTVGGSSPWVKRFDGPWEAAESCVVHTSASVYRRLQESPRGEMSTRGPPAPHPLTPGTPPASGQLLKSESEDSGVEMAGNEHSPSTPVGSESSFSLDGFPAERSPAGEEPGTEPPRLPHRKLVQAAQRSRRQRVLGRCHRGATKPPREPEEPAAEAAAAPRGAQEPGSPRGAEPGQGLRYLEHVCQMLERLAKLQQDNRLLRQQAEGTQRARPDATHSRDPAVWRGERFRPRSCSDSQAPALSPAPLAAPDAAPCRRTWGYSASSPSLLDPAESTAAAPAPDKDGRSHWGRVKALLTRLTRRSLRGGRCR